MSGRSVYGGSDYYRMPTPYGDMLVWCFGRNSDGTVSVGFRTEHEHNRYPHTAPHGGWDGMPTGVTLFRVDYVAHDRARVDDTGRIVEWTNTSPLMRAGWTGAAKTFPEQSSAAVRRWRETVGPAVEAFVASETGREMIRQGGAAAAAHKAKELDGTIKRLEGELAEARRERDALDL